jgi:hypothetical protein
MSGVEDEGVSARKVPLLKTKRSELIYKSYQSLKELKQAENKRKKKKMKMSMLMNDSDMALSSRSIKNQNFEGFKKEIRKEIKILKEIFVKVLPVLKMVTQHKYVSNEKAFCFLRAKFREFNLRLVKLVMILKIYRMSVKTKLNFFRGSSTYKNIKAVVEFNINLMNMLKRNKPKYHFFEFMLRTLTKNFCDFLKEICKAESLQIKIINMVKSNKMLLLQDFQVLKKEMSMDKKKGPHQFSRTSSKNPFKK